MSVYIHTVYYMFVFVCLNMIKKKMKINNETRNKDENKMRK